MISPIKEALIKPLLLPWLVAIFLGVSNYISIISVGYLSGILNYKMMLVVAIILFTLFLVIVETMKKRIISNLKKK